MRSRLLLGVLLLPLALGIQNCGPCSVERGYCDGRGIRVGTTTVRGSGDVVKQERQVSDVSGVSLDTIGTLYIEIGDREELRIEADDNLLEYFETSVRHGRLKISGRKNTNLRPTKPVRYYLTVKGLDMLATSSSGDIVAPDLESDDFSASVRSSGSIEIGRLEATDADLSITSSGGVHIRGLDAERLAVAISSSGSLEIDDGAVDRQRVAVSSSGNYRALRLRSETARVLLSSSGNAYVRVAKDLDAVLSSSGSVYYAGDPAVKQVSSSSGRVRRAGT